KLAPRVSPKKTWAGMVGAVVGAVAASLAFSYFVQVAFWPLGILAGAFAVVEQAGDIFESAFKRHYGVKDSGAAIPGHGGVLDRIDGLVAVLLAAVLVGFFRNPANPAAGLLLW
ncbi:MAG: phosphatidate cytidylyltransferase, partial [Alphaproteobacteria bacterium]|nr:phosphatidate cytidylyltransferase [Alphaproteobacteria bacterium]